MRIQHFIRILFFLMPINEIKNLTRMNQIEIMCKYLNPFFFRNAFTLKGMNMICITTEINSYKLIFIKLIDIIMIQGKLTLIRQSPKDCCFACTSSTDKHTRAIAFQRIKIAWLCKEAKYSLIEPFCFITTEQVI